MYRYVYVNRGLCQLARIVAVLLCIGGVAQAQNQPNWHGTTAVQATVTSQQILNFDPNRVCLIIENVDTTNAAIITMSTTAIPSPGNPNPAGAACVASPPNGWVLPPEQGGIPQASLVFCNLAMNSNPPRNLVANPEAITVCTASSTANLVYDYAH